VGALALVAVLSLQEQGQSKELSVETEEGVVRPVVSSQSEDVYLVPEVKKELYTVLWENLAAVAKESKRQVSADKRRDSKHASASKSKSSGRSHKRKSELRQRPLSRAPKIPSQAQSPPALPPSTRSPQTSPPPPPAVSSPAPSKKKVRDRQFTPG